MPTPTDPVVIVSDDPSFSTTLQHQLEEAGRAATVQRPDEEMPDTIAQQPPRMLVVHASDTGRTPTDGPIAEQVQHAPELEDVPVLVCTDNDALRRDMVKQLYQRRGVVAASSCQVDEVCAKLHDLDAS